MAQTDHLHGIERKSEWLRGDAKSLSTYVDALATAPWFETRAEHAMALAERDLTEALDTVKACRVRYAAKRRDALPSFMQAAE